MKRLTFPLTEQAWTLLDVFEIEYRAERASAALCLLDIQKGVERLLDGRSMPEHLDRALNQLRAILTDAEFIDTIVERHRSASAR